MRNILQRRDPLEGARRHVNKMAEFEAHNLALPGDVLVIQGVRQRLEHGRHLRADRKAPGRDRRHRQGGVRDIAHSRSIGYPLWASDITPVTGKWRIETIEINGPVQIGEMRVTPGDLVVADDTGVCVIPRDLMREVLEACESKATAEETRCRAIDDGISVPDISRATYGEKKA